jgi:hypothetical protein
MSMFFEIVLRVAVFAYLVTVVHTVLFESPGLETAQGPISNFSVI